MAVVLKIPFDKCIVEQERRGAALAPAVIEKEYSSLFSAPKVRWFNVPVEEDFEKTTKNIENSVLNNKTEIIVSLGGDNSVSYGLMRGFSQIHKNACLIYFDAHFDAQDDFLPPTHEDVIRAAIKENFFKASDILIVGVRNYTKEELEFVQKNNIKFQYAKDFSAKHVVDFATNYKNIYFMLDIDVIDPAFAPGTGWPEPLGLYPKDVLDVVLQLKNKIKLLDLVEVSPPKDVNNITSRLAAKIVSEFV